MDLYWIWQLEFRICQTGLQIYQTGSRCHRQGSNNTPYLIFAPFLMVHNWNEQWTVQPVGPSLKDKCLTPFGDARHRLFKSYLSLLHSLLKFQHYVRVAGIRTRTRWKFLGFHNGDADCSVGGRDISLFLELYLHMDTPEILIVVVLTYLLCPNQYTHVHASTYKQWRTD